MCVNNNEESSLSLAVDKQRYDMASLILSAAPGCSYAGRHGTNVLHAFVIHTSICKCCPILHLKYFRNIMSNILYILPTTSMNSTQSNTLIWFWWVGGLSWDEFADLFVLIIIFSKNQVIFQKIFSVKLYHFLMFTSHLKWIEIQSLNFSYLACYEM